MKSKKIEPKAMNVAWTLKFTPQEVEAICMHAEMEGISASEWMKKTIRENAYRPAVRMEVRAS